MSLLLKGILIGLLFGVPVGAVGAMTVQRTWEHGIKAGLLTGMGSSVADCIYAGIGAFGLTMVSDFLLEYQTVIHLVGGAIVLYLGIRLFFRKGEEAEVPEVSGSSTKENGWLVVLGVFLGTWLWWGGLTAAVSLARKKKRKNSFQRVNRIFGAVLSLFGVLVFIKALPI